MATERIRILLVDDEYLTRSLLRNCIDWSSLNMEIVGEAEDADEALSLVDKLAPDVLFTDIQMPIIDGIALSEMVLARYPATKIVVLTGYNEFDYAQRSIKAGVSDYLLKPINRNEVLKSALKVKQSIEQERRSDEETDALRRQLYDNLPYLRERFFNELLTGLLRPEAARGRMAFLGVSFRYPSFQVAVLEYTAESGGGSEESRLIFTMRLLNYVKEKLRADRDIAVFADNANRIVILNNDENSDLYETCERLREEIARDAPCDFCIGVGRLKKEIGAVCGSYREALEAIRYRVAVGNNTVILYDNLQFSPQGTGEDTNELYAQLDFFVRTGLRDKLDETVDKIFKSIDLKDPSALKTLRAYAMNIANICFQQMIKTGSDPEEIYRLEMQSCNQVLQLDTLPDIRGHLKSVADKALDALNQHKSSRISSFIGEIKAYVAEHYADSGLTLASIAKMFYLNPSYLSRTFKKETGVSFVEYLTSIRMEKAIELLKSSDLKIFAIADAVGISDANYFSTCFKKYTGVSMSAYRKALAERQ